MSEQDSAMVQESIDQLWYYLSLRQDERYSRQGQDCLHTKEVLEDAELSRSLRNQCHMRM